MKKVVVLLSTLLLLGAGFVMAQQKPMEIPLYTGKIPNDTPGADEEKADPSKDGIPRVSKVRKPTLTIYLAPKEKATGTAIVVCPGGGYSFLASGHEGVDVAKKFNEMGITAVVLKYRLPDATISPDPSIAPLQDAQQAIRVVRQRAKEWNIHPGKVGIIGFSAGGHLASTAGTHFQKKLIDNPEKASVRPDFMILVYPVISSNPAISHKGSFEKLLGKEPSAEKMTEYSSEFQVSDETPPTFLVHASDDQVVKSENSIVFYQALLKNNVAAEMHIYEKGGHGFGLNNKTTKDVWMDRCKNWLDANGWLKKNEGQQANSK
jgi:acetyl esterase/lipase